MKRAIWVSGLLMVLTASATVLLLRWRQPSTPPAQQRAGRANAFQAGDPEALDFFTSERRTLPGVRGGHGDNTCGSDACDSPDGLDCHRSTVCAFLNGNLTAKYHAPDRGEHIEPGFSSYFEGTDDSTLGIDRSLLFFYAGHGQPDVWNTLDTFMQTQARPFQARMRLGNGVDGLHYLWHCSCRGLAHGRPVLRDGGVCQTGVAIRDFDYSRPQDFQGSATSQDNRCMRNAYARWGNVFDTRLRLICGGSTLVQCRATQTDAIWRNYLRNGFDVADSFILGLHTEPSRIGACLTRGGEDPAQTPLVLDQTFSDQDRPGVPAGQREWLHLEYLQVEGEAAVPGQPGPAPPASAQFFTTSSSPVPSNYLLLREGEEVQVFQAPGAPGFEVVRDRAEGGLTVQSGLPVTLAPRPATFDRLAAATQARDMVTQLGWMEPGPGMPPPEKAFVVRLMIDSVPVQPSPGVTRNQFQKSVVVIFKRRIQVENQLVTEIGSDGTIVVQFDGNGRFIRAWKLWKTLVPGGVDTLDPRLRTTEWAQVLQRFSLNDALIQRRPQWGYQTIRATPDGQELVKFFFRATFDPDEEEETGEFHRVIDLTANAQSVF